MIYKFKINGQKERYERLQIDISRKSDIKYIKVITPSGRTDKILPFKPQPVSFYYTDEGIEKSSVTEDYYYACRYTPEEVGEFIFEAWNDTEIIATEKLQIAEGTSHGYVEVSKKDKRYFSYTDGTPFFWLGINLCFPAFYSISSGQEFGYTSDSETIGLRQYERWLKKCAQNGVNVVRLWLGHVYWSPDTEDIYKLNDSQWAKIDMIVALARKYKIKLKLTLEHFRTFGEILLPKPFHKVLRDKDVLCQSMEEWMTDERWANAWLYKVHELAKRYSGDTTVCMIELWNEMNAISTKDKSIMVKWNEKMLPKVKALFPRQLVTNSLGSLDSEKTQKHYRDFCWDATEVMQVHRYLDQGAKLDVCRGAIIPSVKEAFDFMLTDEKPLLLAETGAVNNCHSGEFKYYPADDRGIIFVDCVYTPIFLGSAGCGNIWHWESYVENKKLFKYFSPLKQLTDGIDFANESYKAIDASTTDAHVLLLKGKTNCIGFIRNKKDTWFSYLRDDTDVCPIKELKLDLGASAAELYPIWQEDTSSVRITNGSVAFENVLYGTLFKIVY